LWFSIMGFIVLVGCGLLLRNGRFELIRVARNGRRW